MIATLSEANEVAKATNINQNLIEPYLFNTSYYMTIAPMIPET